MVALYGLGGAGKTSVAVEYAHRHLAEVGLAWQFPAEDPAVLLAEFARLAAQLGARDVVDARDPVASVHAVLAAFPAGWLVVFDNAAARRRCSAFLPPAGRGRVLITTQSAVWPPGQAVEVPVLDPDVAAGFLVNRTGDADERAAAGAGRGAGRAAAGAGAGRCLYPGTGRHPGRVPGGVPGPPGGPAGPRPSRRAPGGRGRHLGLALSRLGQTAPAAAGLLRLLAFLAPEAVPLRLLLTRPGRPVSLPRAWRPVRVPLLGDRLAAGDAIAALRRYSLVTPAGDGLVSVHRLVQAVTADQMPGDLAEQWQQAAAALVEAAIPDDTELPGTWPVCAALLPHARAVLDLTSSGMFRIAQYLGRSGSYPAARDLFQLITDAHREDNAYGVEHRDTLIARHDLAHWTGRVEDAAGARDQFAALLPVASGFSAPSTRTR